MVTLGFSAKAIIPVLPGNIQTLFFAISGIEIYVTTWKHNPAM